MRNRLLVLLACVAVFVSAYSHARARSADEQEILGVKKALITAYANRDAVAFEQHVADDWRLVDGGGELDKRRMLFILSDRIGRVHSVTTEDDRLRVFADTGILSGVVTTKFSNDEKPDYVNITRIRYTDVFVKQGGRWRLAHTHETLVTPIKAVKQTPGE